MSFFKPDLASPESVLEILISPLLCAFFGLMMFIGAVRYEESYGKPATWWRWCFLPIGLGILFGLQRCYFLTDTLYAPTAFSRKIRTGHYLSLAIPIATLVFTMFWHKFTAKRKSKSLYSGLS